ncbi:hypothetical protein ZWY2020_004302 [Hordeum vulgare]|nr:hypothetical protein ZWY2020_004302 [Hordeum vulgare]
MLPPPPKTSLCPRHGSPRLDLEAHSPHASSPTRPRHTLTAVPCRGPPPTPPRRGRLPGPPRRCSPVMRTRETVPRRHRQALGLLHRSPRPPSSSDRRGRQGSASRSPRHG